MDGDANATSTPHVIYPYNKYYVEGLTSKAGKLLNGKKGIVDHADPSAPGRYAVLMDGADTFVSIHQKNLVLRACTLVASQCPKEYLPPGTPTHTRPIEGLGMFAIRDIKAGELILQDEAFRAFDFSHVYDTESTMKLLREMTPDELQVLRRLSSNGGPRMEMIYPDADCRTVKVNAIGERGKAGTLFLMFSRINHRCSRHPGYNAKSQPGVRVYAARDITCGEEIAIDYDETHCLTRMETLYTNWGIPQQSCLCVDCCPLYYQQRGLLTVPQIQRYALICRHELTEDGVRIDDGVDTFKQYVKRDAANRVVKDDRSCFYNGFIPFEKMIRAKIQEREEAFAAFDNAGFISGGTPDGPIIPVPPAKKRLSLLHEYYRKMYLYAVKLPLFLEIIATDCGQKNLKFTSLPKKKLDELYQELYNVASELAFGDKGRDELSGTIELRKTLAKMMKQYGKHYNV